MIFHGWVAALIASSNLAGFEQRFARARAEGEKLLTLLDNVPGIKIHRVEGGSNIAFLELDRRVEAGRLRLTINETILRKPAATIAAAFAA
jgi:threonine aldolase